MQDKKNISKNNNQFDHDFAWTKRPDGTFEGRVVIILNEDNIKNKSE